MTRLLGFLLALLLALPAVQAGIPPVQHAPASAVAHDMAGHPMMMHHELQGGALPPSHVIHHDCVGCIAPIDVRLYRPMAPPQRTISLRNRPANMAYPLTTASAPEPPPPRDLV